MKTKLRRFVSIFSAMVLMVCCAVPAFAVDTVEKMIFQKLNGLSLIVLLIFLILLMLFLIILNILTLSLKIML